MSLFIYLSTIDTIYLSINLSINIYIYIYLFLSIYLSPSLFSLTLTLTTTRYVYMEVMKRLDWHKVGALTEDGQKYSDYISDMQVSLADFVFYCVFTARKLQISKRFAD